MNDNAQQAESTALYTVDGVAYRLEPLSWQQTRWLGEHIFAGIDMQALDYGVVHDLLRIKGPLFMAICLLPAGMTRAEHARQSWAEIQRVADLFAGALSGEEVALFGVHFFRRCGPSQLTLLMGGADLQRAAMAEAHPDAPHAPSDAPGESGLSPASSPLPMATLPSSDASLPSGVQQNPSAILSAALNGAPSI